MEKIKRSKHFLKYTDPESNVTSYIFDNEAIPLSQSFYFTNPSCDDKGRYIWMYCGFPPAGNSVFGRSLGVVDTEEDRFTLFNNAMFTDASPVVDTENGDIYYCAIEGIYRKTPAPGEMPELFAPTPKFMRGKGYIETLATHLTFSPDRKKLCFDATVGNRFFIGDVDIESGEFELWQEFDYRKNHAQFSPTTQDLMMIAEDDWIQVETGEYHKITYDENGKLKRIWLLEKGKEPVYIPPLYIEARHEWWGPDGNSIYYVDWDNGTIRYDLNTKEYSIVDKRGTWHAHCSKDERYIVADENEIDGTKWYRGCKSRVHFLNRDTGKYVNIITENPTLFTRERQCKYHIDPHPQFTMAGRAVMHTTTVTGKISAAITEVSELIEKTK